MVLELFISESSLQLINNPKDSTEGVPKSIVVDVLETSGKSVEVSVTEVAIFVDGTTQNDTTVATEDLASQGKVLTVIQDFKSHELAIPSDLMLDNILSNLSEISSVLHKVKSNKRMNNL